MLGIMAPLYWEGTRLSETWNEFLFNYRNKTLEKVPIYKERERKFSSLVL